MSARRTPIERGRQGLAVLLFLCVTGRATAANSCLPFLSDAGTGLRSLVLVSLDRTGEAAYVPPTPLEHQATLTIPSRTDGHVGAQEPEQWRTANPDAAPTPLYLSTRTIGMQPFDYGKADTLAVSITVEDAPQVSLAFRSQGMKRRKFRASCSADGVLHGSTADAQYLLLLTPAVRTHPP